MARSTIGAVLILGLVLWAPKASIVNAVNCANTSIGLTPSQYVRSASHTAAGELANADIVPRDAVGLPSADTTARIGFIGIGMSSANEIHSSVLARFGNDVERNRQVKMVNASKSGQTAAEWANPTSSAWTNAAEKVFKAGLTPAQIQAAHAILTQKYPLDNGPMTSLQVRAIVQNLVNVYPNIRVIYLSGHTYTGYSDDPALSNSDRFRAPEPFVHNDSLLLEQEVISGGFPVWVDFRDLWSNGPTPNPTTGFAWPCAYVKVDGVHPNADGRRAAAAFLLAGWKVDPVTRFLWR